MKQSRKARAASLRNLRKARAARRRRSHRPRRRGHRRNPVAAPAVTVARQPNRMRRKVRRKRKHNPATAVAATPTARQPNRARRRTRRKRRSNPVTLQANAVRRSRRTGKFVRGKNRRRSGRGRRRDRRNARRVGARRRNTHYKSVGGYRRKGSVKRHRRRVNPVGVGGLVRNQFSRARLMEYGAGVLGLGLGLTVADLVDRYVATMPPENGQNPWYGRNAAAAYQRRPDVMRLGAQGLGALLSMVATYMTRNVKGAPWLFGGIAGGFGINLVQQGMRWWVMPMLLKAENPTDIGLANRLYPLEQSAVQDPVAAIFENWTSSVSLSAGQGATPSSQSPLAAGGALSPGVYALGKNGQRRLIPTGKLGRCESCGGEGGCYSDCADYNCEGCGNGDAMYEMEHGDSMDQMTAEAGVSPGVVYGLNGGKTFFAAGERVRVPHALGRYLQRRDQQRGLAGTPEAAAPSPVVVPPVVDMSDHFGGNGFSGTSDAAMDLMNGYSDVAAE